MNTFAFNSRLPAARLLADFSATQNPFHISDQALASSGKNPQPPQDRYHTAHTELREDLTPIRNTVSTISSLFFGAVAAFFLVHGIRRMIHHNRLIKEFHQKRQEEVSSKSQ